MPGTVTTVDVDASLSAPAFESSTNSDFLNEELYVVEAEVERVFGGGGSKATVDVIFDGFLTDTQKDLFERLIEAETISDLPPTYRDRADLTTIGVDPDALKDGISVSDLVDLRVVDENGDLSFNDIVPEAGLQDAYPDLTPREAYTQHVAGKTVDANNIKENLLDVVPGAADAIISIFPALGSTGDTFTYPTVDALLSMNIDKQVAWSNILHSKNSLIDPNEIDGPIVQRKDIFVEEPDADERIITDEELRALTDITLTIDVTVQNPVLEVASDDAATTVTKRLFTGTLTKVVESNKRIVTLSALDRRLQLNRNSVIFDAQGQTIQQAINSVLPELGYERGTDYFLVPGESETNPRGLSEFNEEIVGVTWGLNQHTTVFEFLQDLMRMIDGTIHIDNKNKLYFYGDAPDHDVWGQRDSDQVTGLLPPIVEWVNSEEEEQTQTVAKAPYDSTGLGIYSIVGEEEIRESLTGVKGGVDVNDWAHDSQWGGVTSRAAVESEAQWDEKSDLLLRDSGTVRVIGDPRITPYDSVIINDDAVNAFAPISTDKYMTKTVRHIMSPNEGYISEIELGSDPEELFRQFAQSAGTRGEPGDDSRNNDVSKPDSGGPLGGILGGIL